MSDVNFNVQGDANFAGDVAGGNITKNYFPAPVPAALSLHQLPAPPADFTGREAELKELRAALKAGGVTISGLHGLGGVGKTALALMLANELVPLYPDAQFYLNLRGTEPDPLTPAQAYAHIIRAYYPESKLPDDEAQLRTLYHSVLAGQRALLLLDNARDAKQVAPLLPPPGSLALLTSRQTFTVPGLRRFALEALKPEDAEALIFRIAERLGSGGAGVKVSVTRIAALCGYLPLALRAAASFLAENVDADAETYARDLESEAARLELAGLKAEGLPTSVQASLNLSYTALPTEAQKVLRALSAFPDDFDAPAAEVVCEDAGHKQLSLLLRWSLVNYAEAKRRYRLHDLTRAFARALCADDERATFSLRHATHYESVLRQADKLYQQGHEHITTGLALFDLERTNIEHGQAWVVAPDLRGLKDPEGLAQAAAQLCNDYPNWAYVLNLRLHPRQQIAWLEAALAAARQLQNRECEGYHLGNLGIAYANLGEARKAIEFHEQALVINRKIRNHGGEGVNLGNIGVVYRQLGETRRAIEFIEQSLKVTRKIGNRRGEGNAIGNLGIAYANLGEARKAIEFFEQALVIAREIGDRRGEGITLGNIGLAYIHIGEAHHAIAFYEQQLVIVREIGDQRGEGTDSWNMALAFDMLGERAKAISLAEAALKIYEAIEDPRAAKVKRKLAEWKTD